MSFDPNQFMEMEIRDSNSTESVPCPIGEYIAVVESVKMRTWQKKDDPSVSGLAVDLVWNIDDQEVKRALDRDKVNVKQGLMLDLTEAGGIDTGKGKNVGLGRLREAASLNEPGRPFTFSMLVGKVAKVKIKHRVSGDAIFAEVEGVAKI